MQHATTAESQATSSVTVQTRACRRPTVVHAITAARPVTLRVTVRTSRSTTASATTAELLDTSREIVLRVAEVAAEEEEEEERLQHRTMIATLATSRCIRHCLIVFMVIVIKLGFSPI